MTNSKDKEKIKFTVPDSGWVRTCLNGKQISLKIEKWNGLDKPQKKMKLEFTLPWSPGTNHYYVPVIRKRKGKRPFATKMLSAKARAYPGKCFVAYYQQHGKLKKLTSKLTMIAELCPPKNMIWDADNFGGKPLGDALKKMGLIKDDSQIEHWYLDKGAVKSKGCINVMLEEIE